MPDERLGYRAHVAFRPLGDADSAATALGTIEHRVKGLELGADDISGKPFAFAELLARVRTLLRRGAAVIIESRFRLPI